MKLAKLRWVVPLVVTIFVSGPAFAAAGLPTVRLQVARRQPRPAAPTAAPQTAPGGHPGQIQSYAQREQQAAGLEKFKGGVGIYIGGSAVVLLLLVILLVLLSDLMPAPATPSARRDPQRWVPPVASGAAALAVVGVCLAGGGCAVLRAVQG